MLDAATPPVRAAIALGAYTGLRQGDVFTLTWGSSADGYIRQNKTGDNVFVPGHSWLTKILDATPKTVMVVVIGTRGKPYTEGGFRTMFQRYREAMLKAGKIGAGLTFHGLCHTVATKLADAGADDRARHFRRRTRGPRQPCGTSRMRACRRFACRLSRPHHRRSRRLR